MKRTGLLLVLATCLAGAACADDGAGSAPSDPPPTAPTPTAAAAPTTAAGAFPVTITDQYGDVTIPERPTRVVTSGNYETDVVLDLGVVPVAMAEFSTFDGGVPPWRAPLLGDAPPPQITYAVDGYDVEETLTYQPDLVLNQFLADDEWATLNAAVPTVSMPYAASMEELVTAVGQALGLDAEAAELLAETDAAIADVRAAHPELEGLTLALGYAVEAGMVMNYTDSATVSFLEGLGFVPHPPLDVDDFASYGLEQISRFDADVLIIQYGSESIQATIEDSELFQRLDVVESGGYLGTSTPGDFDLLRPGSPAAVRHALDTVVPEVTALVAGIQP